MPDTIVIGPSFGAELAAAGLLGLPFSWTTNGLQGTGNLTTEQAAAVGAVLQAHQAAGARAALIAYAADRRWRKEIGGIVVAGVPIATDDRSKIMIMGARVAAAADPEWTTIWHGADGQTYPVAAAAMIAISSAVEAHVNATFATFAAVKAGIEAGEITATAAIDAAFAA